MFLRVPSPFSGSFAGQVCIFDVLKPHCRVGVEVLVLDCAGPLSEPFQSENLHPVVLENSSHISLIIFSPLLSLISLCLELLSFHLSTFFEVFILIYLLSSFTRKFCNGRYTLCICQNAPSVQHRTKGEPRCQLRTLCDNDGSVGSSLVINVPSGGDVDSRGEAGGRQGVYENSLCFSLHFAVKLKLPVVGLRRVYHVRKEQRGMPHRSSGHTL